MLFLKYFSVLTYFCTFLLVIFLGPFVFHLHFLNLSTSLVESTKSPPSFITRPWKKIAALQEKGSACCQRRFFPHSQSFSVAAIGLPYSNNSAFFKQFWCFFSQKKPRKMLVIAPKSSEDGLRREKKTRGRRSRVFFWV